MGFFGRYVYDGARWLVPAEDEQPVLEEPWLSVDVYDSDITTIVYRPADESTGIAFLGETPRSYWADTAASAPTDVNREAAGLAAWWARLHPEATDTDRDAKAEELAAYLAADAEDADEVDEDEFADEPDLDDADVFVEIKTARFLAALDLPVPEALPRD